MINVRLYTFIFYKLDCVYLNFNLNDIIFRLFVALIQNRVFCEPVDVAMFHNPFYLLKRYYVGAILKMTLRKAP